jgi:O-antigen ligase
MLHRMQNRNKIIKYITSSEKISLLLTLALLSAPRSWSLYPIWLFLLSGLIHWILDFRNLSKKLKANWFIVIPPVTYFAVQLCSTFLMGASVGQLVNRLLFILIPLFGFPFFITSDFKRYFHSFIKAYIAGIIFVAFYLIIHAFYMVHLITPEGHTFFQHCVNHFDMFTASNFSVFEHPSYFSMKIIWCLILIYLLTDEFKFSKFVYSLLFIFLSTLVFLLASKAAIVVWLVLISYIIITYLKNKIHRLVLYGSTAIFVLLVSFLAIHEINRVKGFISGINKGLKQENIDWKNLDQRTREWYSATQLIKEKPLTGFGLHDVDNRMVQEYHKHGWEEEATLNLNAHNQFLEAQMTFGIAGSLSLLWMLLTPLIIRRNRKYPQMCMALILLISFFLLFESMFNRQWGIMFFVLFYCMLLLDNNVEENDLSISTKLQAI